MSILVLIWISLLASFLFFKVSNKLAKRKTSSGLSFMDCSLENRSVMIKILSVLTILFTFPFLMFTNIFMPGMSKIELLSLLLPYLVLVQFLVGKFTIEFFTAREKIRILEKELNEKKTTHFEQLANLSTDFLFDKDKEKVAI